MTQIIEEIPRLKNHDVFLVSSTYSLGNSFKHLNKELCDFNARSQLLRLADQQQHMIPLSIARTWDESQNNLNLRRLQAVSRQIGDIFIVNHYVINQYA